MFNASHVMEAIHDAKEFGINVGDVSFDWAKLKRYRDRYISRLNTIYEGGLDKMKITRIQGYASFIDENTLRVGESQVVRGDKILVAVGGSPASLPIPGGEHVIDSDGFFELETQPTKAAIIGSGYIAVELGGVFNGLGTEAHLFARENSILRTFDPMIQTQLIKAMNKNGPKLFLNHVPERVEKNEDGKFTIFFKNGQVMECMLTNLCANL